MYNAKMKFMKKYQFKQLQKEIALGKRPILVGQTLSLQQYKTLLLYPIEESYSSMLLSRVDI